MVKGLYTAYTGMIHQQNKMEVITNNLANASTTGFKKEGVTSESFKEVFAIKAKDGSEAYINRAIGNESLGVKVGETYVDYSQGSFKSTGNPFDLALSGEGFFTIAYTSKKGDEEIMYSRDGSFLANKYGQLVTKDGDFLIGQNGIITVPLNEEIVINEDGSIYAGEEYIDTLKITAFEDVNYLKKFGENLYKAVDGATEKQGDYKVVQGYLEMSNMNVVTEMVNMIEVTRAYETNQKVIQTIDSSLEQAIGLSKM